jgi:divalent metal cation (Fe/Co/Zn/Cd) transporter
MGTSVTVILENSQGLNQTARGIKAALVGLLVNIILVIVKLLVGIAGHSYALVADAIESSTEKGDMVLIRI